MDLLANILISAMIAATPLLFAAIGELVAERSGVLNLGVEGMMLVGAVAALRRHHRHQQRAAGAARPRSSAGPSWRALFGVLTLTLRANQVASGLALTMFGLGLSALWSARASSACRRRPSRASTSRASAICRSSASCSSPRTAWSISPSPWWLLVAWVLDRTRLGLIAARHRREPRRGARDRLSRHRLSATSP